MSDFAASGVRIAPTPVSQRPVICDTEQFRYKPHIFARHHAIRPSNLFPSRDQRFIPGLWQCMALSPAYFPHVYSWRTYLDLELMHCEPLGRCTRVWHLLHFLQQICEDAGQPIQYFTRAVMCSSALFSCWFDAMLGNTLKHAFTGNKRSATCVGTLLEMILFFYLRREVQSCKNLYEC